MPYSEEVAELILCITRRGDCKVGDCKKCGWNNRREVPDEEVMPEIDETNIENEQYAKGWHDAKFYQCNADLLVLKAKERAWREKIATEIEKIRMQCPDTLLNPLLLAYIAELSKG